MQGHTHPIDSHSPLTQREHLAHQPLNDYKCEQQGLTSQDTKNLLNERKLLIEESTSRIWSNITSGKLKEVKEVIQIMEQKSSVLQNVFGGDILGESGKINSASLEKPYYIEQPRAREEYWNKESILSNESYLKDSIEQRQNHIIHEREMKRFFPNQDQDSTKHKQVQAKCIELLMKKCSTQDKQQSFNVIKTVDLLYKKYILLPVKGYQADDLNEIYKAQPIRGQRYYRLSDTSLGDSAKLVNSQISQTSSFKRNAVSRGYAENCVSLVDNESTNQTGDYYQNIANTFINGIRKQKFSDLQEKLPSKPQNPSEDKFKKLPNARPDIPLPFDIQIPQQTARKQFNPGYNLFQGPDDEKNQRFQQERTIAKTFVKDGYGLQIVRNYMPNIDGGGYNRAITTIIRESYKKIEDFLLKQCNIKIHSLTSSQFSLVKTPLVHCRNILCDQDRGTFFKYIAITYKFGKLREDIFPTAEQTLRLYKAIVRGLNDRRAAKEMNPKPSKEKDIYFSR